MFAEFVINDNTYSGTKTLITLVEGLANNNTAGISAGSGQCSFYFNYGTTVAGGWATQAKNFGAGQSTPNVTLAAPVTGKTDLPGFRKGFGLRTNSETYQAAGNISGFMGSFQGANTAAYSSFDFDRALNHIGSGETAGAGYGSRRDSLTGGNGQPYGKRFIMSVTDKYLFLGCIDTRCFYYVGNASPFPLHDYASSLSIPMIGITGQGNSNNSEYNLFVHTSKYATGDTSTYNSLLSTNQDLTISNQAGTSDYFLRMYPSSQQDQFMRDRYNQHGNREPAVYPMIVGNPYRGNPWQIADGLVVLSGQNHYTGQVFYVGDRRYYKMVCTHNTGDYRTWGINIGILMR